MLLPASEVMLTEGVTGVVTVITRELLVTVGVPVTTRLAGKGSVKPTPVKAMGLALVMTRLIVEVPLVSIVAGMNDLAIVGALTTCKIAVLLVL